MRQVAAGNGALVCGMAAVFVVCAGASSIAAATEADARETLARHGLTRSGSVWLHCDEVRLRRDLAELPKRRQRILAAERELGDRIEQNRQLWRQNQPVIATLRKSLGQFGTDDPQRALIQERIDALTAAASQPARLGRRGEVRSQIVAWNDERNRLAIALTRIRTTIDHLGAVYQALAESPSVADALRTLGEKHRLGPQRDYAPDRQKLGDYERLAFTPWVPIFWQGSQVRLTALVNDLSPVTFTWAESGVPGVVLTRNAAEAAGLSVPANAPREAVSLSPQQRATARRMEVARLRLGKCVLENVTVLVLPPEAEDWGCRLGREALAGHSVEIEPENLRLWIDRT